MITTIAIEFTEVTSRFQRPGAQLREELNITAKVERQSVPDGKFDIEAQLSLNEAEKAEFKALCEKIEARFKTEVTP